MLVVPSPPSADQISNRTQSYDDFALSEEASSSLTELIQELTVGRVEKYRSPKKDVQKTELDRRSSSLEASPSGRLDERLWDAHKRKLELAEPLLSENEDRFVLHPIR